MNNLPRDPIMLLSVVNTNLRDFYSSLDDFCLSKDISRQELEDTLIKAGYKYSAEINQFI